MDLDRETILYSNMMAAIFGGTVDYCEGTDDE